MGMEDRERRRGSDGEREGTWESEWKMAVWSPDRQGRVRKAQGYPSCPGRPGPREWEARTWAGRCRLGKKCLRGHPEECFLNLLGGRASLWGRTGRPKIGTVFRGGGCPK